MKSRRLTETDLANLAFKPRETKRLRLTSIEKPKRIIGSYEPFRSASGDAVNVQLPLLPTVDDSTPLSQLEAVVSRACKGDEDRLAMNLPVARATHKYAVAHNLKASREDIHPITLPFGHKCDFGFRLLMEYPEGHIAAVFPDLRRTQQLTTMGQRVVFSLMHQRWRENNPDFAELDLEIWRYLNTSERSIKCLRFDVEDLIPYDTLILDIRETFEIWHNVVANAVINRRDSEDDSGPLFGSV